MWPGGSPTGRCGTGPSGTPLNQLFRQIYVTNHVQWSLWRLNVMKAVVPRYTWTSFCPFYGPKWSKIAFVGTSTILTGFLRVFGFLGLIWTRKPKIPIFVANNIKFRTTFVYIIWSCGQRKNSKFYREVIFFTWSSFLAMGNNLSWVGHQGNSSYIQGCSNLNDIHWWKWIFRSFMIAL